MYSHDFVVALGLLLFSGASTLAQQGSGSYSVTSLKTVLQSPANRWNSATVISFPDSTEFLNHTGRWTTFDAPTFAAAISPANEDDLVKTVKLATASKVPFLATGKRHGYTTTLGALHNGLAVDLSMFDSYSINKTTQTITVGASVSVAEFQHALYQAGFVIQGGSASCPGYVGVTLGGGVGRFQGYFGLVVDALVSARVLTAKGDIVTASLSQNPDLFWALRGAGANFGIVLSATYKVQPLPNKGQILTADFYFPLNMSSQYFKILESYSGKMPKEMAVITSIAWDESSNSTIIAANWIYIGPEQKGRDVIAPLIELNPPVSSVQVVAWDQLISTVGGGAIDTALCQKGLVRDFYSANLKSISAATYKASVDKLNQYYQSYAEGRSTAIDIETFPNQAMAAVPYGSTAYPWRDTNGYIQISVQTPDANSQAAKVGSKLASELRNEWVKTSGYPELTVYLNYAHGDEKLWQIYGRDKLPTLAALKKKWDPTNVFGFNNPIPTQYS
ncbi:putative FAD-binding PCMH-type domain-containing protein [Seiridium unicorne]|uniref:FAD-binding PCMH-type domain-containing protein n=1 Tax=Seiridium unicorne TaxID=138068 RepID=A0ABR2VFD7_9PEZI